MSITDTPTRAQAPQRDHPIKIIPTGDPKRPLATSARNPNAAPYQLDLRLQTCECGDWEWNRSGYPVGHDGRLCKHLAVALLPEIDLDFSASIRAMRVENSDPSRCGCGRGPKVISHGTEEPVCAACDQERRGLQVKECKRPGCKRAALIGSDYCPGDQLWEAFA